MKNQKFRKRFLSLLLALAVVVCVSPQTTLPAHAAEDLLTITYDAQGGYFNGMYEQLFYTEKVARGSTLNPPEEGSSPNLSGMGRNQTFAGWYTDPAFTKPYNGEAVYEDTVLFAKWDRVSMTTGLTGLNFSARYFFDLRGLTNPSQGQFSERWAPFRFSCEFSESYYLSNPPKDEVTITDEGASNLPKDERYMFFSEKPLTTASWEAIYDAGYVKGNTVNLSGITAIMRLPSVGTALDSSTNNGWPFENEFDAVALGFRAFGDLYTTTTLWGQEIASINDEGVPQAAYRANGYYVSKDSSSTDNFTPVLQVGIDEGSTMKAVALVLNGGTFKSAYNEPVLMLAVGDDFAAPAVTSENFTAPISANYNDTTFDGWNTARDGSGTSYTAEQTVPQNVGMLYAQWRVEGTYNVRFNSNGGTAVSPVQEVAPGATIAAPTAPTRTGYTFDGWYKEQSFTNPWNFGTDTVTADTTLYAKWTAIPSTSSYTVTFNSNGGTEVPSLTGLDSGAKIAAPTAPSREAYTFGGWYKDESLITPWNFATDTVTANTVLYAKWVSKKDRFSTATAVYDKDGNATTPWEITDDEDDLLPPVDSAVDLNVWARILSASDKVYKVDIEWGAMTFEYVTGKWDTELHAYSGEGSWSAGSVDGVNNKITLTNHSNGSVDANFAQSMESAVFGGDVTGGFYETETAAKEAAGKTPAESGALDAPKLTLATADGTTVAEAPKGSLYFALSGTPNGGTAGSTPIRAGSLTVTVVPGT